MEILILGKTFWGDKRSCRSKLSRRITMGTDRLDHQLNWILRIFLFNGSKLCLRAFGVKAHEINFISENLNFEQMEERKPLECWAVVELMGHQRIAGQLTERAFGPSCMFQINVPDTEHAPAFTRIYAPGAVYAIHPCTEETARMAAATIREMPILDYDMQQHIKKYANLMSTVTVPIDKTVFDDIFTGGHVQTPGNGDEDYFEEQDMQDKEW